MQYMGSKNRLAKHIVPIIQSYITSDTVGYLEPFVGGANVIDKIDCSNKVGYDIHEYLIELLKKGQRQSFRHTSFYNRRRISQSQKQQRRLRKMVCGACWLYCYVCK